MVVAKARCLSLLYVESRYNGDSDESDQIRLAYIIVLLLYTTLWCLYINTSTENNIPEINLGSAPDSTGVHAIAI